MVKIAVKIKSTKAIISTSKIIDLNDTRSYFNQVHTSSRM